MDQGEDLDLPKTVTARIIKWVVSDSFFSSKFCLKYTTISRKNNNF